MKRTALSLPGLVFLAFCFLGVAIPASAQSVSTVANLSASDGLALDAEGNLYATRYASPPSLGTVFKITPHGTVSTFLEGQPGPADLTFDTDGNLYLSNFNSSTIEKITPDGEVSTFASGFPIRGPLGLVFDEDSNLYVLNDLTPTVVKITPDGQKRVIATIPGNFGYGSGITRDDVGNSYVASYSHGRVYKITPMGEVSLFATSTAPGFGFILYVNGAFYATAIQSNRIYKFTMEGEVSVLVGTGVAGHVDGDAASAQFSGPNGLVASPTGDTLYVAEGGGYIRRIILDATSTSSWEEDQVPDSFELEQNYPNPFNPATQIRYSIVEGQTVRLQVFDLQGNLITTLEEAYKPAGVYEAHFDASTLASGVYMYRLQAGQKETSRKMVLSK